MKHPRDWAEKLYVIQWGEPRSIPPLMPPADYPPTELARTGSTRRWFEIKDGQFRLGFEK